MSKDFSNEKLVNMMQEAEDWQQNPYKDLPTVWSPYKDSATIQSRKSMVQIDFDVWDLSHISSMVDFIGAYMHWSLLTYSMRREKVVWGL